MEQVNWYILTVKRVSYIDKMLCLALLLNLWKKVSTSPFYNKKNKQNIKTCHNETSH